MKLSDMAKVMKVEYESRQFSYKSLALNCCSGLQTKRFSFVPVSNAYHLPMITQN